MKLARTGRINRLIEDALRDPCEGIGKHALRGITEEHRLVCLPRYHC